MLDFFNTSEDRKSFLRRINALAHNSDFNEILDTLKKYRTYVDSLLRYVEDDTKMRQLQGRSQCLTDLIELVEETNTNKI